MYFRAEDTSGLREIYNEINTMEKSQVEVEVFNQYTELAAMFLFPAFLIFLVEILLRNTIFRTNP
jgi:Ca-activated chloride channel family protein